MTVGILSAVLTTVVVGILEETIAVVVVFGRSVKLGGHFLLLDAFSLFFGKDLGALLVQLGRTAAVHLEPPVANQLRLLEDGAVGA